MRCLQTKAEVNELIFWSNGDVCVCAFSFRWDISVCVWNLLIIWWAVCFEGNFKHPLHYCKNSFHLGKHLRDLSQMMKCTWDSAWFHNRSLCVCVWPHERWAAQKFIADSFHCDRLSALKRNSLHSSPVNGGMSVFWMSADWE